MKLKASRFSLGFLAVAAAALVCATGEDASAQPPASEVSIASVRLSGSACPAGTYDAFLVDNNRSFVIVFNQFNVSAGPMIPLTESSKDCAVLLTLNIPEGWTYAVGSIVAAGHAELQRDVVGRLRVNARFPGTRSGRAEIRIVGPTRAGGQDFETSGVLDLITYSRCGRSDPLLIGMNATADNTRNRDNSGLLTVTDLTGTFVTKFNLVFQRC